MIEMLSLLAGDEEKFIVEQETAGTPVQDMSVKNFVKRLKSIRL